MLEFWQNINWDLVWKIFRTVLIFVVLYFIFFRLLKTVKKRFLKKAKTKKEKSNVEIFFRASQYFLILLLLIFAFLAYGGSLTGIGVVAGLLSAALGWALQRPITGMAAWLMVVVPLLFQSIPIRADKLWNQTGSLSRFKNSSGPNSSIIAEVIPRINLRILSKSQRGQRP